MILLDTHAWTRWLHPELGPNLTPPVHRWIEESDETLAVSVISCLEISQLVRKGKLTLPVPLPRWFDLALDTAGITCLPLSPALLHASVGLPEIHKDPADRIIIATAQHYDAWLVTRDENIQKYPNLNPLWNFAPERQRQCPPKPSPNNPQTLPKPLRFQALNSPVTSRVNKKSPRARRTSR